MFLRGSTIAFISGLQGFQIGNLGRGDGRGNWWKRLWRRRGCDQCRIEFGGGRLPIRKIHELPHLLTVHGGGEDSEIEQVHVVVGSGYYLGGKGKRHQQGAERKVW